MEFKGLNEELVLFFISDVHHAQAASDEDLLAEDIKEKHPHRLFIGLGDELDCIARIDRRHKLEDLKDRFTTKKTYPRLIDAEIEDYADIIAKYTNEDEWLGHISGNHPMVMTETSNIDPTQRLCDLLKHQYLGYSAYVPLNIKYTTCTINLMILCHHGFGGTNARKEGSGLNSYVDHALRYEGWDIAAYAHRHDRFCKTIARIEPQRGGIKPGATAWVRATDKKVLQAGTYLRTLSHSLYPTYSEKAGYPPKPLGCLKLRVGLKRTYLGADKSRYQINFLGSNE